jgi:peptidyl-prolyl cis-trans isomerase B (cyclophilin B)
MNSALLSLMTCLCWLAQPVAEQPPEPQEPQEATSAPAGQPAKPLSSQVRAVLRPAHTTLPVGGQVYVEFVIQNVTDEAVTLTVPGALRGKERPDLGMGLPLEHVFSGPDFRGLEIASERNPTMGNRITRKPEYPVPPITVAAFASVGLRFDVARFYPGLHQAGVYRLTWHPYGGAIEAPPVTINVVQYKQVVMETDQGTLTMRLLYDKAPRTVENFLDLVEKRFYNGKTFHCVYPNQFVLGGCPSGNGTGKRPDGGCIEPEFNDAPFEFGTVGMALIESDPKSASCQFFICLSRQKTWDGRYTAFAKVEGPASLETLQKMGSVAVDDQHRPVQPLVIKSMTAVEAPPPTREKNQ